MPDAPLEPRAPEEIASDDLNAHKNYSPAHTILERNAPEANNSEEIVRILNTSKEVQLKQAQDRPTETDTDQDPSSSKDIAGPSTAPDPEERVEVPRGELTKHVLLNSCYPRDMLPPKALRRPFNTTTHCEKLTFFRKSPYDAPKSAKSLRFWTEEQEVYYTEMMCFKKNFYEHQYLNFRATRTTNCFQNVLKSIKS